MPGHMMTGWKCLMQAEESCSLSNHEQLRGDGMQSFFAYIVIGYRFIFECLVSQQDHKQAKAAKMDAGKARIVLPFLTTKPDSPLKPQRPSTSK